MRDRHPEAGCPFVCHSPHYCCLPPASRPPHRATPPQEAARKAVANAGAASWVGCGRRVSKCYTPTQRPRHTQPQPRPCCHYLPGTTTTLRLIPQNLHCAISLKIFCTHLKLKHSLEWWEFLINLINSFLQSVLDFFLRCTL